MSKFFDKDLLKNVVAGLIVAVLLTIIGFVRSNSLSSKYDYITGNYHGYYLAENDSDVVITKVKIYTSLATGLMFRSEEITTPNYIYEGQLEIVENRVFGYLEGENHPARSFVALRIPFNRTGKLPSINGVFSGITQHSDPASVKIIYSRTVLDLEQLRMAFNDSPRHIMVKSDTKANENKTDLRRTIDVK